MTKIIYNGGLGDIANMLEYRAKGFDGMGLPDNILYKGAEMMIKQWQQAIEDEGLIDTGDMHDSVAMSRKGIHKGPRGHMQVIVGPMGTDSKGERNGLKAGVLNYGKSSRKGSFFLPKIVSRTDAEFKLVAQHILDVYIETGKLQPVDMDFLRGKKKKKQKKKG